MRPRLLLGLLLLAGAALAGGAPSAVAQTGFQCVGQACEQGPPTVTVSPGAQSFSGTSATHALTVTITWCDDSALQGTSASVRLNGSPVTGAFTYAQLGMTDTCRSRAQSSGAVQLADGANTLVAEIRDQSDKVGQATVIYTYTRLSAPVDTLPLPARYTMDLTASDPVARIGSGGRGAALFRLRNTGNRAGTFTLTPTCAGAATACEASASTLTLERGGERLVAVHFTGVGPSTSGLVEGSGAGGEPSLSGDVIGPEPGVVGGPAASAGGSVALSATWQGRGVQDEATVAVEVGAPVAAGLAGDLREDGGTVERGACLMLPAGLDGVYECGDLRLAHPLPPTRVLSRAYQPTLLYLSQHAAPEPVVGATLTSSGSGTVRAQLTQQQPSGFGVTRASLTVAAWTAGEARRVSLSFDAFSEATGLKRLTLGAERTSDGGLAEPLAGGAGWVAVVNRINSPFGNGWWLAGLESLVPAEGGAYLWVGGDGSTVRYRPGAAANVLIGDALTRPDTLLVHPASATLRFERRLPGGARVWFDPAGRHVRTENALGIHTEFLWNAAGRLAEIRLPRGSAFDTGLSYVFAYDAAGRLLRVTAPGNRIVTVHGSAGRIDSIAAPDGSTVGFRYAGSTGRITGRVDPRGVMTTWMYGAGGKLTSASIAMEGGAAPIVYTYAPQEAKGLLAPEPLPTLYTRLDGPRTDLADHTDVQLSARGGPVWTRDAIGRLTTVHREDPRFPAAVTRVTHPNGREVSATYDDGGRPTSTTDHATVRDGSPATTLYEWDRRWSALTRATLPEGETRTVAYDAVTGQRVWEQAGADSARRVRYAHHPPTSAAAPGLLASVTSPDGTETVEYDALGNVSGSRDATGYWSAVENDAIGQPLRSYAPVDSARATSRALVVAHGLRREVWYDAMGRDTLEVTRGPARAYTAALGGAAHTIPAEEVWVRKTYRHGLLVRTDRWASPDSNGVGVLTTEWRYDNARRTVREVVYGGRDSSRTVYDAAGNVTASVSRLGEAVTMRYDALNRLVLRITPGVTRQPHARMVGDSLWVFPYFVPDATGALESRNGGGTPLVIPPDTARFTYHVTGGIATADNREARIRREYSANGALLAETQTIRSYAGDDTTRHVYRIEYEYDRNGRRILLRHPASLLPAGPQWQAQRYAYRHGTGELAAIEDPRDRDYTWSYDPAGRLQEFTRNGVTERFTYDATGRQVRRVETSAGAGVLFDDRLSHDARGKTTGVQTLDDLFRSEYSGIGALHRTTRRAVAEQGTADDEVYRSDGLANPIRTTQLTGGKGDLAYTAPPEETRHAYEAGTGRVRHRALWFQGVANTSDSLYYDAAGNRIRQYAWRPGPGIYEGAAAIPTLIELAESYYDAAGQLRVHDRRTCLFFGSGACDRERTPLPADRAVFEEYRYDALGRRVLVRSRQEWRCPQRCQSTVRRTVWDGDQVLWEVSAPGWTGAGAALMERDTGFSVPVATRSFVVASGWRDTVDYLPLDSIPQADIPTRAFFYGRVMYVHGPGIDAPLSLTRFDYSDSIPEPVTVFPHADWRGRYALGTYGAEPGYGVGGTRYRCVTITRDSDFQQVVPEPGATQEPKPLGPRDTQWQHCLEILWPAPHEYVTRSQKGTPTRLGPPSWMGSLLDGMRDVSGMMYRRNRYYDPSTAQFTQEDPIGLAGGLNLYGFANGDPVSYSDPYGLSAQECDPPGSCEAAGVAIGTGVGAGVGGVVAAGCTAASSGVCVLGAPAIVGFFAAGGAAFGGLVGVLLDEVASEDDLVGEAGGDRAGRPFTPGDRERIRGPEGTPCTYCGRPTTRQRGPEQSQADHIIPRSQGGNGSQGNGTNACRTCNLNKGPRSPQQWQPRWYSTPTP